jgi:hypothetical protein
VWNGLWLFILKIRLGFWIKHTSLFKGVDRECVTIPFEDGMISPKDYFSGLLLDYYYPAVSETHSVERRTALQTP